MENSECLCGFLHDFQQHIVYSTGVVEICTRCKEKKWFRNEIPNHIYLSYHLRSILKPNDKRYNKEYATR